MHKYRYMPQHNAFAAKIFGLAVRFETGVDLNELLTLAQIVALSEQPGTSDWRESSQCGDGKR